MQVAEPDTTYLMDLDAEALLTPWEGGMMGANEVSGLAADRPPWRGGSKVAVVSGKYRDGLRSLGGANSYLFLPLVGVRATDQFTDEFFVKSSVAWASLSNALVYRHWSDYSQYISVIINAGTVLLRYRHDQDAVFVDKTLNVSGQTFAADAWVSVAFTLKLGVLRLYVNGVSVGNVTGCTSPLAWHDYWANASGLIMGVETPELTMSDVRISRLARVPGEVPAP